MAGKCYTILIFLLISIAVRAQEPAVDYNIITKIKDEGFNRSQVMSILFNLTDVTGPRLTGSAGLKQSEQWVVQQLNSWGLSNTGTEAWGTFGKGWEIGKSYLAMTAPYYQPLIGSPKAWTPGTNGLIKQQAMLMKVDNEQDFEKYKGKLAGKIVVIPFNGEIKPGLTPECKRYTDEELKNLFMDKSIEETPEDHGTYDPEKARQARQMRQKLMAFLAGENPALLLTARGGTMGTFNTTNGASYASEAKPALPEMEISPEHLSRLVRLLDGGKEVTIEAEVNTSFNSTDSIQYNVIGEIPGTDKALKNEVVIIGAHLDSWHSATGATDNAAGCAVMMEVMRILKTIDVKPRRTIRLVLWSGEEQGLLGSKAYVKNHYADPATMELKPEHEKVSAYYNLDNGAGRIRGIYLQGNDAARPLFEAWLKPFEDMGANTVTSRNTGSTDHIAFDQVGIPGFQFIQDPMDYFSKTHHTNMDTYDRVQKADLMQASVIIAALAYQTAILTEKIPRKPLPKSKTTGKS